MSFTLNNHAIDHMALRNAMLRHDAGGFCVFEGWVREHNQGRQVTGLTYEAYASLAIKQGNRILADSLQQNQVLAVRAEHRIGSLRAGDLAVWIGVSSVHRDEAFSVCRQIIEAIKADVPIWKHEFYSDGSSHWVDPTACHCGHKHTARGAHA